MAVPKETISEILNYHPIERSTAGIVDNKLNLGEINEGIKVVYGLYPYQLRVVCLPGEPKVSKWTTQPALALESEEGVQTLVYPSDVAALGGDLASKVLQHLNTRRAFMEVLSSFLPGD